MINTLGKFESDYSDSDKPVVDQEIVPFTGDNIIYYVILLSISVLVVGIVLIVKRSKNKQIIRA